MTAATFWTLLSLYASAALATETVNISIQRAYHGIPIFAAQEFGWFAELGVEVNISLYDSGAPQVEDAVTNQAWDFGIAGSVPNVLGGAQGLYTIGINNDESGANVVVGSPGVKEWPPQDLAAGIFGATPSSTGELVLRKCLVAAGLVFNSSHIEFAPQRELMTSLAQEEPRYGALWAPNTYSYANEYGNDDDISSFCSGQDVDFPILGGLMVRPEWAEENEGTLLKVLAAYLRGVSYMQNAAMLKEVLATSKRFYEYVSVTTISELAMRQDVALRPLYDLDSQIRAMDRNSYNDFTSELDDHYVELVDFLRAQEVLGSMPLPVPEDFVQPKYMDLVSDDPELREFAYLGAKAGEETSIEVPDTPDKVRISLLAAFDSVPVYIAQKFGWFDDLGLDIEMLFYDSGAPQVAENAKWDIGISGSYSVVQAAARGLVMVGISDDESAATGVYGAPGVTEWPPSSIQDGMFGATMDSDGELLLRQCLVAANVDFEHSHLTFANQSEILSNLPLAAPLYGALWSPHTFEYVGANVDAEVKELCSGSDVSLPLRGGLMVHPTWAENNQDILSRVLAAYLRGVTFLQNSAEVTEVAAVSSEFFASIGHSISASAVSEELASRPLYGLDAQVRALERNPFNRGISDLDSYYMKLVGFLNSQDLLGITPQPREFIQPRYMNLVSNNPALRNFTYLGTGVFDGTSEPTPTPTNDQDGSGAPFLSGFLPCLELSIVAMALAMVGLYQ